MKPTISTFLLMTFALGLNGTHQDEFLAAVKGTTSLVIRTGPMNPGRFDTVRYLYETDEQKEIKDFINTIQLEEPKIVSVEGEEILRLSSFCESSYVFEFRKEEKEGSCAFGLTNCDSDFRSLCLSAADVPLMDASKESILSLLDRLEREWEFHEQEVQALLKSNE